VERAVQENIRSMRVPVLRVYTGKGVAALIKQEKEERKLKQEKEDRVCNCVWDMYQSLSGGMVTEAKIVE
jgi:hypothetical protein